MAKVAMKTTLGDLTIELDFEKAPLSSENFLGYVKSGFYEGTLFHRVIPGFMAQGGGMNEQMEDLPTKESIQNEANNGVKNLRGTLAMARTMDPHSASSQFFINLSDNDFLNFKSETPDGWGYAVFGKVVEGMETVDEMAKAETGHFQMHQDVPKEPIKIIEVKEL